MQAESNFGEAYRRRERVLLFLPAAGELERLDRSGALAALARTFEVSCVVPPDAAQARIAVAAILPAVQRSELQLGEERLRLWRQAVPPARHRRLIRAEYLRARFLRALRGMAAVTTPMVKAFCRGLLWLAQRPVLSRRVRRALLAIATLEVDEILLRRIVPASLADDDGSLQAGPAPVGAVVEMLDRTRPLFALLPTDFRDAWFPDVLRACESHGTPCVVLEKGWDASGVIRGTPPVVWCGKAGLIETSCAAVLSEMLTAPGAARAETVTSTGDNARVIELAADIAAPYARRVHRAQAARVRRHISNAYGADGVARSYAGADGEAHIPGYWMHGWLPSYHNIDPSLIALHKQPGQGPRHDYEAQLRMEKRDVPQWVSREDQATYLARHGYRKVRAIGLPIVYLPPVRVRRVPDSLLVMPPHGHASHGPGDPIAQVYADTIADIRKRFAYVGVCLSQEDLEAEQWAGAFRKRGFEVFAAVDPYKPDALLQLKRLLCSFEFVTTNGFGSHIAYAAYCGARVSVFGPYAEIPIERMARTHAVRMFPELLGKAHELCREAALRRHYGYLFTDPDKAMERRYWGAHEAGETCKAQPDELARLFGWKVRTQAPDASVAVGQW